MTCEECDSLLWAFAAAELDGEQHACVDQHVSHCPVCRRRLDEVHRLAAAARTLADASPSLSLCLETKEVLRLELEREGRVRAAFGPLMDAEELAKYLKVDVALVYRHLDEIPHFELEGQIRFRRQSIDEWTEAKERGSSVLGFAVRAVS